MEPNTLCAALPVFDLGVFLAAPDSPEAARLCAALAECLKASSTLVVRCCGRAGRQAGRGGRRCISWQRCWAFVRTDVPARCASPCSCGCAPPPRQRRALLSATPLCRYTNDTSKIYSCPHDTRISSLPWQVRDPRVDAGDSERFLSLMERYFGQAEGAKRADVRADLAYQVSTPQGASRMHVIIHLFNSAAAAHACGEVQARAPHKLCWRAGGLVHCCPPQLPLDRPLSPPSPLPTQVGATPEGVEKPRCLRDPSILAAIEGLPADSRPTVPTEADVKWCACHGSQGEGRRGSVGACAACDVLWQAMASRLPVPAPA